MLYIDYLCDVIIENIIKSIHVNSKSNATLKLNAFRIILLIV